MSVSTTVLNQLSLFHGVDVDALKPFLNDCLMRSLEPSALLLKPSTQNSVMYIVIAGQLGVYLDEKQDNEIALIGSGECVGELSVFDGQSPSAWVRAITPVTLLAIERDQLWTMIDHSHQLSINLLSMLSRKVRSGNQQVGDSREREKEFEQHANIDALTSLYNRRWINNYFQRFFKRKDHDGNLSPLAILIVDVDFFKAFNDKFGHHVGDVALRTISNAFQNTVRPSDFAARFGGEEFLLILPDATLDDARMVAERVRCAVEQTPIVDNQTNYPSVTVSIGVGLLHEQDSYVELFASADNALYAAKEAGRNCVCVSERKHSVAGEGMLA